MAPGRTEDDDDGEEETSPRTTAATETAARGRDVAEKPEQQHRDEAAAKGDRKDRHRHRRSRRHRGSSSSHGAESSPPPKEEASGGGGEPPAAPSRSVVVLLGDEELVAQFLLAGWGERRSDGIGANWLCVRETTPAEEIERRWRTFVEAPNVAVVLLGAAAARRTRGFPASVRADADRRVEANALPTVVEIPGGDAPPRVTCTVYEPYSGWRAVPRDEAGLVPPHSQHAEAPLAVAAGRHRGGAPYESSDDAANNTANPREDEETGRTEGDAGVPRSAARVDALVAAVFRLATLGRRTSGNNSNNPADPSAICDDDDDDDDPSVRKTGWRDGAAPSPQHPEQQDAASSKTQPPGVSAALAFKLEVLNAATTEIADLLQGPDGARDFVRALNRRRTRMIDVGAAFPFLAGLTLTVLDRCMARSDVDSILTAMMLAQSFYRTKPATHRPHPTSDHRGGDAVSSSPEEPEEDGTSSASGSSSSRRPATTDREYLKAAIQSHPVWGDAAFWRDALAACVTKQQAVVRDPTPPPSRAPGARARSPTKAKPATPPPDAWSASTASAGLLGGFPLLAACLPLGLRQAYQHEATQQVALWSQLGGIVHAMLEFGVHGDAVRAFVDAVASENDLTKQQRAAVVAHIDSFDSS